LDAALGELQAQEQELARRAAEQALRASGGRARDDSRRGRGRAEEEVAWAEQALAEVEAELAAPDSRLAQAEAELQAAVAAADEVERIGREVGGRKTGAPRKTPGGRSVARKLAKRDRKAAIAERRRRHAQARLERARARAADRAARAATAKEVRANVTDPQSRIMKSARGWVQGYNAQAAVSADGLMVAAWVTQDHNDVGQCTPMMAAVSHNLAAAGIDEPVGVMLFDAGYLSEDNLTAPGPDRLIATAKSWQLRQAATQHGHLQGAPAPDANPIEAMEHRLRSQEGASLYGLRQHTVEPVFGDAKCNRGFSAFMRRGLRAVQAEWQLIGITHNLLKLHRHGLTTLTAI
jgi:hypothetical protein